jgi:hypothetical protein
MSKPHRQTVEAAMAWMNGSADGRGVAVLSGPSAQRLNDKDDLVALHAQIEQDWLTRFVRRYLRILFVVSSIAPSLYGQIPDKNSTVRKEKSKALWHTFQSGEFPLL